MSDLVELRCSCAAVKGRLKIVKGSFFHVQCLCCDCQKYASHLKYDGKILDEHGGTELFQTYPQYMEIIEGKDNIGCLQLHKKGLYRWYTTCCSMPLANTMSSPNMPFVGIPVILMQFDSEDQKRELIGPVSMKAFGKYAMGDMPKDAYSRFPMSYIPKILVFFLKGLVGKKSTPSPFFREGKAAARPKIL